jgi:hypothetical protein
VNLSKKRMKYQNNLRNRKMKNCNRSSGIAGIFIVLIIVASCSSSVYQGTLQSKPVVIDGNPNDWSLPLRFIDTKTGLQYNVTNDETNLYVCVRAVEQPLQMKIVKSGLQLWIDPSGKNKETVGIKFPLGGNMLRQPATKNMQPASLQKNEPGTMEQARYYQSEGAQITLTGFKTEYNGTFISSELKDIKASVNWDEHNIMTYEVAIPIRSFYNIDTEKLKDNPVFGLSFKADALAGPGGGAPEGARQGGHAGGGGGQGSGGGKGGMGGGRGGSIGQGPSAADGKTAASMNSPVSVKFKIRLTGMVKH